MKTKGRLWAAMFLSAERTHLRALAILLTLWDVYVQLIKTWPLTITPWWKAKWTLMPWRICDGVPPIHISLYLKGQKTIWPLSKRLFLEFDMYFFRLKSFIYFIFAICNFFSSFFCVFKTIWNMFIFQTVFFYQIIFLSFDLPLNETESFSKNLFKKFAVIFCWLVLGFLKVLKFLDFAFESCTLLMHKKRIGSCWENFAYKHQSLSGRK